jgi:hypothetical protein
MGKYSTSKRSSNSSKCGVGATNGATQTIESLFLLSITSILVAIVLINYHTVFSEAEKTSKLSTMQNVAAKIARDVHTVYLLTIYPGNMTIQKRLEIPEYIGGNQYLIELKKGEIVLKQDNLEVNAPISSKINVTESVATSVSPYIVYNMTTGTLEVRNLEK